MLIKKLDSIFKKWKQEKSSKEINDMKEINIKYFDKEINKLEYVGGNKQIGLTYVQQKQ